MKQHPNIEIEKYRDKSLQNSAMCAGTNAGMFRVPSNSIGVTTLTVVSGDGGGWDHVSVRTPYRCPLWSEMCQIKDLFFRDDEVVMQLHPAKSEYVNHHPFTLHLWRPQTEEERAKLTAEFGDELGFPKTYGPIPLPPKEMV